MSKNPERRLARIEIAVRASTAVLIAILGLLSAVAGLPWWLSVPVAICVGAFGVLSYHYGHPPTRPVEILALTIVCGILILAARGAQDLLNEGSSSFRYFATEWISYSRIVPWSKGVVIDEFSEGNEVRVICYVDGLKRKNEQWFRIKDGSYVQASAFAEEYPSQSFPSRC